MDLYEYQARELLEEQHIPTPRAVFAQNSHEVAEAADAIGYLYTEQNQCLKT